MKFHQQKIAKALAWNSEYNWFIGPYLLRDNLKTVNKGTNSLATCLWDDKLRLFAWEMKVTETHVFVDIEFYPYEHFIIVEDEPDGRVAASCRRVAQTIRKLNEISKDDTEIAFNHYRIQHSSGYDYNILDLVDFLCMVYLRNRDPNLLPLIHDDFGLGLSPMGIWFTDEHQGAIDLFRDRFNEDWSGRKYVHGSAKTAWDRPQLDDLVRVEDDRSHSYEEDEEETED